MKISQLVLNCIYEAVDFLKSCTTAYEGFMNFLWKFEKNYLFTLTFLGIYFNRLNSNL